MTSGTLTKAAPAFPTLANPAAIREGKSVTGGEPRAVLAKDIPRRDRRLLCLRRGRRLGTGQSYRAFGTARAVSLSDRADRARRLRRLEGRRRQRGDPAAANLARGGRRS